MVVDDAAQGITHVVRGEDLADNSARQILLQRALGYPTRPHLHTPLVLGANGEKLSKQNGAAAVDLGDPLAALNAAAAVLGLSRQAGSVLAALEHWTREWATLYNSAPGTPKTLPPPRPACRRSRRQRPDRAGAGPMWPTQDHQELRQARRPHHHRTGQGLRGAGPKFLLLSRLGRSTRRPPSAATAS